MSWHQLSSDQVTLPAQNSGLRYLIYMKCSLMHNISQIHAALNPHTHVDYEYSQNRALIGLAHEQLYIESEIHSLPCY